MLVGLVTCGGAVSGGDNRASGDSSGTGSCTVWT